MTIHLPEELESSILRRVRSGQFASLDDAMAQAARLLLRGMADVDQSAVSVTGEPGPDPGLGSIGAMSDAADELDEIVAEAMRRREQPWRATAGE